MRRLAPLLLVLVLAGCGGGQQPPAPQLVTVHVRNGLATDRATGVVVGRDRVLTVAHVLGTQHRAQIVADGEKPASEHRFRAIGRVVRVDEAADAALLSVPGVDAPRLALSDGDRDVRLRGRSVDAEPLRATFTDVLATSVRRPVLKLNATVASGDSGTPVLDADGRLAGLVFAADDDHPGTAWATAADGLRHLLR